MRVLCLAAHPDDEVLGAGGTLLRRRAAGDEIGLVVATAAYVPRWPADVVQAKRAEAIQVARELGVSWLKFLDFRSMHLAAQPAMELNDAVAAAIGEFQPEVVYAPPFDDVNSDHAALFQAALVAARPVGGKGPRQLYSYEIPTTTRFNVRARWEPTTHVDISGHVEQKLRLMELYESELREAPHPRSLSGIRAFARERGAAVGVEYAECHMLVRELVL